MNILIIGLGSIAQKHIFAINKIDKKARIYALRSKKNSSSIKGIQNVYKYDEIKEKIDFCIISNPTFKHYDTILNCIDLDVPLFIEKPSLMNLDGAVELDNLIQKKNIITYVAHNLRFHPVIQFLKTHLNNKRVVEVNIYCGSYLPDWRPDVDYTKNYSAHTEMGGGVHLDLIHEINYSLFLFGKPKNSISLKTRISDLKINSIDFAAYHLIYDKKVVNIVLNYFRKQPKREIEIIMSDEIITADLLKQNVKNSSGATIFSSNKDNLETYYDQMKYFYDLVLNKKKSFNSFKDSLDALKICLK